MREGMRLPARKKRNDGMKSQQKLECFLPALQEIFKLFKQILLQWKHYFLICEQKDFGREQAKILC